MKDACWWSDYWRKFSFYLLSHSGRFNSTNDELVPSFCFHFFNYSFEALTFEAGFKSQPLDPVFDKKLSGIQLSSIARTAVKNISNKKLKL